MRQPELFKYNPTLATAQEIKETFVARGLLLEELLKELQKQAKAKSNQHLLLIGPRGIGKSNLLLMIRFEIQEQVELYSQFIPLAFKEEEYRIISLRDFFERVLELLAEVTTNKQVSSVDEEVKNEKEDSIAIEKAIQFLKSYSHQEHKKILLFIDNFHLILRDQSKTQQARLRELLMNENFMLILGASPTYFKEISEYKQPFYQFFKTYDLEDLSIADMESLLEKRSQFEGNTKLLKKMNQYKTKLKAIRHLTGGNPRLLLMLYHLITQSEIFEVRWAINSLLDDLTPYYKHRIENLAPQQRKIVDLLARLDKAATPTELAKATRLPVNQVSSHLNRLRERGFITTAKQVRRKSTLYILSERLFRIWHQMRYASVKNRRLPFLIDFISIWYTSKEWKDEFSRLERDVAESISRGNILAARQIVEHIAYFAEAAPTEDLKLEGFDSLVESYSEMGAWDEAESELLERIKENQKLGRFDRLAGNYFKLGNVYGQRWQEDKKDDTIRQAFEKYRRALELEPDSYQVYNNWGNSLGALANIKKDETLFQQAFEKYQKALDIKPDLYQAYTNWGSHLGELAKMKNDEGLFRRAFEKYQQALDIKPDSHDAYNNWGAHLGELATMKEDEGLFQQAFEKYQRALDIKPDLYQAYYGKGILSAATNESEDIIKYISKAFQLATQSGVSENNNIPHSTILYHAYLRKTVIGIQRGNWGSAKESFLKALERQEVLPGETLQKRLVKFFTSVISPKRVKIFDELIQILKERKKTEELEFLNPFIIVNQYWKSNDQEILDRLNPEMREIVEQILEKAENER